MHFAFGSQTVEKAVRPQGIKGKDKTAKNDKQEISTRHSSRVPCAFLLFPFLHSGVPPYADECKNEKSTYLFRGLPACRDFLGTLRAKCILHSALCFLLKSTNNTDKSTASLVYNALQSF